MKIFLPFFFLAAFFTLFFSNCSKEKFHTGDVELLFSVDTLTFDTVFTQVGSATRSFKIFNPLDKTITISSISMENGDSKFNINVDGTPGPVVKDIEIGANDSIYIFAEVTVDPNQPLSISPFVLSENLLIKTAERTQKVVLEAWGQNANYIPSRQGAGKFALLSCDFGTETWDDPKPYVIYGILIIQDCTLNLPKGAKIYVHGGVALSDDNVVYSDGMIYVGENGRLNMQGTNDEPVLLQSDRLEEEFVDVPGQWKGVRYGSGSLPSEINHTKINSAIVGLQVDSAANVTLDKVIIQNTSSSGILAIHSTMNADNCLITDNGGYGIQLEYGGNYELNYCTVASYTNQSAAIRISNTVCTKAQCEEYIEAPIHAQIKNSIFFGSQKDEVELFDFSGNVAFDYSFKDCVVRVKDLTKDIAYPDFFDHCNPCINGIYADPLFQDVDNQDYQLDTLSIAQEHAAPIQITDDLLQNMRDATNPDIGCYEYQD